jgi:hypothetical protein
MDDACLNGEIPAKPLVLLCPQHGEDAFRLLHYLDERFAVIGDIDMPLHVKDHAGQSDAVVRDDVIVRRARL